MTMNEHWLGLLIVVSLLWLTCRLWARGLAWGLPRGRCRWPRRLRPCTPQDCPACQQPTNAAATVAPTPTVPPWRSSQCRRGRPKTIATAGHACPNPACRYHGITDAAVHALVGCGHHGAERIQDFRCQACQTKVSARRDTALYRLKTPTAQVSQVLTALAEGLDLAAASRVFGHSHHTIVRWLDRGSAHAERLHARHFRGLAFPHLQLDELRTRLRGPAGVRWLWLAVDPQTKAVPALHLGRRDRAAAHTLVHALVQTLAPGCLPVFTSDGLTEACGLCDSRQRGLRCPRVSPGERAARVMASRALLVPLVRRRRWLDASARCPMRWNIGPYRQGKGCRLCKSPRRGRQCSHA